jgi:hypothetical protein
MTTIAEKLSKKLMSWKADVAHEVEHLIEDIIELADHDGLDILRSRKAEQEVLDMIDEDASC